MQSAIVLSILLSFASIEFLGLFTGGLITGGYLAYYLDQPLRLLVTYVAGTLSYLLISQLARYVMLFGRRRYMACLLAGLALGFLLTEALRLLPAQGLDLRAIGYLVPGLIANDMMKQGIVKTLLMSLLLTVVIRLLMMLGGF